MRFREIYENDFRLSTLSLIDFQRLSQAIDFPTFSDSGDFQKAGDFSDFRVLTTLATFSDFHTRPGEGDRKTGGGRLRFSVFGRFPGCFSRSRRCCAPHRRARGDFNGLLLHSLASVERLYTWGGKSIVGPFLCEIQGPAFLGIEKPPPGSEAAGVSLNTAFVFCRAD